MAKAGRRSFGAALQKFTEHFEGVQSFHISTYEQTSEEKDGCGQVHAKERPAEVYENESEQTTCEFGKKRRGEDTAAYVFGFLRICTFVLSPVGPQAMACEKEPVPKSPYD